MKNRLIIIALICFFVPILVCSPSVKHEAISVIETGRELNLENNKNEKQIRKDLTAEQYRIVCDKGTEPAFSGQYCDNYEDGIYYCINCGTKLFNSEQKYDSGSGWPSFWGAIDKSVIAEATDLRYGMIRTEITCKNCGAHLGHVFSDGPQPTGLRYCVNSASLDFKADQ